MTARDNESLVARLRRQETDDGTVEVKSAQRDLGAAIWDSVSAFANTRGGTIILGLDEGSGFRPVENFQLDRVRDQFVEGIGDGGSKGRLTRPPRYELSRAEVEDRPVLIIQVTENEPGSKPCFVTAKGVNGGSFRRVDDKDVKLSATEIFELEHVMVPSEADRAVVPDADESDLDDALVNALLERKANSKALRATTNRLEKLSRLNVMRRSGDVQLAGLLALGTFPQQYFPRLLIDVTVHPQNKKSPPGSPLRFIDRVLCDGPLPEAIEDAISALRRNLRTHAIVTGDGRADELEIPVEVLREAISNAVLHREYGPLFSGQPVTVDVYPDRLEITNPGGLWGGTTPDNIASGVSRCRNQALMQLLQDVPSREGKRFAAEGQGSGVMLMISEMDAHALARPRFDASPDQVKVTLYRHGAEIPAHRAWLHDLMERDLSPREDAALILARQHGEVTVHALRDDLRIDSDEARALLAALQSEGALRPTGPERYALVDSRPTPTSDTGFLSSLSTDVPMSIQDIAAITGRTPNTLRPVLRRLVAEGRIIATAPPQSRHRRYLLKSSD